MFREAYFRSHRRVKALVHESHLQIYEGDPLEYWDVESGDKVGDVVLEVLASASLTKNWSPANDDGIISKEYKDILSAGVGEVFSKGDPKSGESKEWA